MPAAAGTLLIPSGPAHNPGLRHLHVVCTDPDAEGKQVVVSITTWTNDLCDATCIMEAFMHPYLRHKSYVFYRKARIETSDVLEEGLEQNIFEAKEPMNGQAFLRIRNGICASPHTPRKVKRHMGCAGAAN